MSLSSEQLLPVVYDQLRKLAAARLASQPDGQTLQPTALVHEVWLRLGKDAKTWADRAHFYRTAAQAMRGILVDRAREKSAQKRGANSQRVKIEDLDLRVAAPDERMLLIEESLVQLERENPKAAEIVLLKFFGGLSNEEMAKSIGVSEVTARRRWAFAKARLFQIIHELNDGPASIG